MFAAKQGCTFVHNMGSRFFSRSISASNTIHEAAEHGNIDKLQQFVDAGKEMGYPARETLRKRDTLVGATCLHYAAEHGRTECAKVSWCKHTRLHLRVARHPTNALSKTGSMCSGCLIKMSRYMRLIMLG